VLFDPAMSAAELLKRRTAQEVYPVVDAKRRPVGLITNDELKLLDAGRSLHRLVIASDVMRGPAVARARDDLRTALETMLAHGIPRLPVVDDDGRIAGLVDEAMIARAYLHTHTRSLH
jgi:CBS domain-containing protein